MIEKMSHYTFLVYHRDYTQFLSRLQELGVLHVTPTREGNLTENSRFQTDIQQADRLKKILSQMSNILKRDEMESISQNKDKFALNKSASELNILCKNWEELCDQISQKEKIFSELDSDIKLMTPWGDFEQMTLDNLEKAGWKVRFWSIPHKHYNIEWEGCYNAYVISQDKKKTYYITVNHLDEKIEMNNATEHSICPSPASTLIMLQTRTKDSLKKLLEEQGDFALQHYATLEKAWYYLRQDIDLQNVELNTAGEAEGKVMLLEGWVPTKQKQSIDDLLNTEGIYFESRSANREDDIPIQLSNNKFFRLFEPLTKLYMLPKYGELDLTLFFAPFFLIFFGLCLGDMGYGLLIMVALPIFTKLFRLINPEFKSSLVFLFGLSTVICGSLTGTAFGFSLYDIDLPFFQKMKSLLFQDNQAMFYLSLIIGCVQILFGMILKAVNFAIQLGFKYAVSTIGWIMLLVSIALAALTGSTDTLWFKILMIVASCMILLYNSPGKNVFLNIGLGLWDAYNMITGLLGDVLSYVRLFALGLSGGILASVFNSLATGMSPDIPVVGFLVTTIIFVIGHGLNIFMNILGSMVHPMRLTFVEFFKNSGYEGGGNAYKPFKK